MTTITIISALLVIWNFTVYNRIIERYETKIVRMREHQATLYGVIRSYAQAESDRYQVTMDTYSDMEEK